MRHCVDQLHCKWPSCGCIEDMSTAPVMYKCDDGVPCTMPNYCAHAGCERLPKSTAPVSGLVERLEQLRDSEYFRDLIGMEVHNLFGEAAQALRESEARLFYYENGQEWIKLPGKLAAAEADLQAARELLTESDNLMSIAADRPSDYQLLERIRAFLKEGK